jgi:hypothetical protein
MKVDLNALFGTTLPRDRARLLIENLRDEAEGRGLTHLASCMRSALASGGFEELASLLRDHVLWIERGNGLEVKHGQ